LAYDNGVFEWDRAKNEANFRRHGLDFVLAAKIFDGPTLEADDIRAEYGERRIRAIGRAGEEILFVVYTWRGEARPVTRIRVDRDRSTRPQAPGGRIRALGLRAERRAASMADPSCDSLGSSQLGIISARRANRRERDGYGQIFG